MIFRLILTILMLSGCSQVQTPRTSLEDLSEPQKMPFVSCGRYMSWNDCNQQVAAKCPNGYQVIKREENHVFQSRELYYQCK